MLKKILIILISIIFIIFSMTIIKIENPSNKPITPKKIISNMKDNNKDIINNEKPKNTINNKHDTDLIGSITIDKLNIKQPLYSINSPKNNIEQNITILKESIPPTYDNSIMFIAAHSGTGHIAFFKKLDKLKVNDEVKIVYENNEYVYIIKSIWEEEKNGYINVSKGKEKQLVLTTCSPGKKDYQLIVNCILKS